MSRTLGAICELSRHKGFLYLHREKLFYDKKYHEDLGYIALFYGLLEPADIYNLSSLDCQSFHMELKERRLSRNFSAVSVLIPSCPIQRA